MVGSLVGCGLRPRRVLCVLVVWSPLRFEAAAAGRLDLATKYEPRGVTVSVTRSLSAAPSPVKSSWSWKGGLQRSGGSGGCAVCFPAQALLLQAASGWHRLPSFWHRLPSLFSTPFVNANPPVVVSSLW